MKIRKTVLIVDDDAFFLKGLSETMEEVGLRVLTAISWADMTPLLRTNVPDIILLDYINPSLDGIKICNILKKSRRTQNVPILLYSGLKPEELKQRAQEVGAQGIIEKSHDFAQITHMVLRFLRTQELH
ncbi:response regulator [bacterium]|nr:response regulator [bacterium]